MLDGKVAIVTGGTRGIGLATVRKFLQNGAKVVLFGSREETVNKALEELKNENANYDVFGLYPNLSNINEVKEAFSTIKDKYGKRISYLPYGTRKKLFRYIFIYFFLCLKTIYLYCKIRPKYIVTTGTHTAGPMCYLGKIFRSKIIYIETFANKNKKTATGRLIYPIADLFIVQWEEMLKLYPKAKYGGAIY